MYRGDSMKIKKVLSAVLSLSIITSAVYYIVPVDAVDFEGKESEYMKLCSSSSLSSSNKSTCEDFNTYLKNKNSELTKKLAEQKETANDTKATLESVQKQLDEVNAQISSKEAEVEYLNTTITNLQASIEKNNAMLKDRMYSMQSYANENIYINFIFGASSFTEMFSRIDGYNELTQSDKELIDELNQQRKQVEAQQATLEEAKIALVAQQEEQKSLKTKYTALLEEQQKAVASTQNAIYDYGDMTEELDAAIKKFNEEAAKVPDVPAPPPPKPTPTPTPTPDPEPSTPDNGGGSSNGGNETNNGNNNNNNNNNSDNNNNGGGSSDSRTLGEKIYAAAYTQLGKRYWWGASGPNYYDCSGLIYWSLNKAGYKVGRTTAAGYSRMGSSVSWSNSQTGDLVCFGSPAYHIGIVIVNSNGSRSVIHAGGGDSSTHGDNPKAYVKVSSLDPGSYYYGRISTIRRVG